MEQAVLVALAALAGKVAKVDRVLAIIDRQNNLLGIAKGVTIETNINLIQPIQLVEVEREYLPDLQIASGD